MIRAIHRRSQVGWTILVSLHLDTIRTVRPVEDTLKAYINDMHVAVAYMRPKYSVVPLQRGSMPSQLPRLGITMVMGRSYRETYLNSEIQEKAPTAYSRRVTVSVGMVSRGGASRGEKVWELADSIVIHKLELDDFGLHRSLLPTSFRLPPFPEREASQARCGQQDACRVRSQVKRHDTIIHPLLL